MTEEKSIRISKLLRRWNPFDKEKTVFFLFDVAEIFNAEAVFIMDHIKEEKILKINKDIYYNKDAEWLSEEFALPVSEPAINRLIEDKQTEAVEYNIAEDVPTLYGAGIGAFLAAPMNISQDYDSVLLICSKSREPYEIKSKEGDLNLKYGNELKIAIEYIAEEISKRLRFVWSFENEDPSLWKDLPIQFDYVGALLSKTSELIRAKKIDAAIDILERIVPIVRRDSVNKKDDIEKIEVQCREIASLFCDFVKDNPPIIENNGNTELPFSLQISSNFLLAYFLYFFIKELLENEELMSGFVPCEKLDLLTHLGTAIKFYLYRDQEYQDQENTKNTKGEFLAFKKGEVDIAGFTNSLCHLVGEYTHNVIGVERLFNIEGHLKNFVASQTVLYSLKSSYQEHFFHMIDICFLGLFLLKNKLKKKTLLKILSNRHLTEDYLLKNWFIVALFHDIGYVLDVYRYIHEEPEYIKSTAIDELRKEIKDATEKAIDSENGFNKKAEKMLEEIGIKINMPPKGLNHGIVSVIHVLNIIDKELSKKSS